MDVIKKLDINIVLPPDLPKSSAIEWANKCYERSFRKAIEKAVSSFDDSEGAVIPNIRIDLGNIEESEIPFRLESRLKDEIARYLRSTKLTRKGEGTEEASSVRSSKDKSNLPDKIKTEGSAIIQNVHDRNAIRKHLALENEPTSGSITPEKVARTVEEELFQAYLLYVAEGYSDLEVLGKRYSFQEIASMVEASLAAEVSVCRRTSEKSAPKADSIRTFSAGGMAKPPPRDDDMADSKEGETETEAKLDGVRLMTDRDSWGIGAPAAKTWSVIRSAILSASCSYTSPG